MGRLPTDRHDRDRVHRHHSPLVARQLGQTPLDTLSVLVLGRRGVSPNTICAYESDGDWVHVSTYGGIAYASGHGWWDNVDCPSYYTADVTITLEEKLGGTWYPQGDSVTAYNVYAGGGSGNRATAKIECVNATPHYWRSQISATINQAPSTSPLATTQARYINCY